MALTPVTSCFTESASVTYDMTKSLDGAVYAKSWYSIRNAPTFRSHIAGFKARHSVVRPPIPMEF